VFENADQTFYLLEAGIILYGRGFKDEDGLPRNCCGGCNSSESSIDRRRSDWCVDIEFACFHKTHRNNEMINLIANYFFRFLHKLTVSSSMQSNETWKVGKCLCSQVLKLKDT
jgi:hypothetical protein